MRERNRHPEIGRERKHEPTRRQSRTGTPPYVPTWLRENPVRDRKEDECDMSSEGFSSKDFFTVPENKKVVSSCLSFP